MGPGAEADDVGEKDGHAVVALGVVERADGGDGPALLDAGARHLPAALADAPGKRNCTDTSEVICTHTARLKVRHIPRKRQMQTPGVGETNSEEHGRLYCPEEGALEDPHYIKGMSQTGRLAEMWGVKGGRGGRQAQAGRQAGLTLA